MTVCVGIKVRDCIVFAADSAVAVVSTAPNGEPLVANIWNHGIKVFNLRKGLPIVAMTAGMGNFGPASISNLAKDLRKLLSDEEEGDYVLNSEAYTIEEAATKADRFFFDQYQQQQPLPASPHLFEFWIGGYDPTDARGEIWKLAIRDGLQEKVTKLVGAEEDNMVLWGGQSQAISRLIQGMDANVRLLLENHGLTREQLNDIEKQVGTPLVDPTMPVQDAIDLADFLVDLTKRYSGFLPGANVVGGETDIATVTKHEGFKWIRRKHYYPEHLNRTNTDHV